MQRQTTTDTQQQDKPGKDESPKHYRFDNVAAPHSGKALYINHPSLGWVPVLDQFTDIEIDRVIIAVGSPNSGAFNTLYETFYSEYADLVFDAATAEDIFPERLREGEFEPADELVSDLPASTPGESNLAALDEEAL